MSLALEAAISARMAGVVVRAFLCNEIKCRAPGGLASFELRESLINDRFACIQRLSWI